MSEPGPDATEDALSLLCPLPILRAKKALARLAVGQLLLLLSDDDAVRVDLPAWCAGEGHELVSLVETPGTQGRPVFRGLVRRGR